MDSGSAELSAKTMGARQRDARLEALPALGADGLVKVRRKRVAVLGVGNIGGQLAHHLVLLGIPVVLVDRDVVAEANLGTQGFAECHIGRPKVDARAEWLGPLNPTCRIEPVHADIRQLGMGALREFALFFSCLDNRPGRLAVNEVAMRLGIPWIDAALDGSGASLFGRVACYDPRTACACYLCPHDSATLRALQKEAGAMGCSGRWWTGNDTTFAPTLAVSALGGAVASIQAVWGLTVLLDRAEEVGGREVYFDLGRQLLTTHRLTRNPRCLVDHQRWHLIPLGARSEDATVAETFKFAEDAIGNDVVLQLPRRTIVLKIRCPQCGQEKYPYRVLDVMGVNDTSCACGSEMVPFATDVLDRFGRQEANPFLDRTWAELGLPPAEVVVASAGAVELPLLLAGSWE
jgi:molybdopterin/thiamine biosynthesis adenylyltransferase